MSWNLFTHPWPIKIVNINIAITTSLLHQVCSDPPHPCQTQSNYWSAFCCSGFHTVFYKWNHILYSLHSLDSFTQHLIMWSPFVLLCTAIVDSFLLLSSILNYQRTPTDLFTHLGSFLFWTIANQVAMNTYAQVFVWTLFLVLLGKYLGVKQLD